jgi:aminoglycoside phosphotransferase (APT) family kinase protein
MKDMLQLAGIPRSILPPKWKTYVTADEYYTELAEMHLAQLIFQHNDLVASADHCRNKYVARQIFRRLAREGKLSTFGFKEDNWSAQSKVLSTILSPAPPNAGSFRLYCDDLRAGNILLDYSNNIPAIIDWEFTYAAPSQFSLDPPWWLFLDAPDMWDDGIEDWVKFYEPRMKI